MNEISEQEQEILKEYRLKVLEKALRKLQTIRLPIPAAEEDRMVAISKLRSAFQLSK